MELLGNILVFFTKTIKFLLVVTNGVKQLRIGSLSGEELLDDLLYVREAGLSPDLLESLLDLGGS